MFRFMYLNRKCTNGLVFVIQPFYKNIQWLSNFHLVIVANSFEDKLNIIMDINHVICVQRIIYNLLGWQLTNYNHLCCNIGFQGQWEMQHYYYVLPTDYLDYQRLRKFFNDYNLLIYQYIVFVRLTIMILKPILPLMFSKRHTNVNVYLCSCI